MIKLKWRVDPKPTYSSFARRAWPSADYPDGSPAVQLICKDDYDISLVKSSKYEEITILVADYSRGHSFEWRTCKYKAKTLNEAKNIAMMFIFGHPQIWPKSLREKTGEGQGT